MCFRNLRPRRTIFLFFLFCLFVSASRAQEIEATVKILSLSPAARVRVEGKISADAGKSWSFLQNYADVTGLGERIENLKLFDAQGREISIKKLAAGEFEAEKNAASFQYDVRAEIPKVLTASAHVSWLAETHGLLMLNDLMPNNLQNFNAKITFEIPENWRVTTSETRAGEKSFSVKTIEKAVFLVGKDWREQTKQIEKNELNLATVGEWQFTDAEAFEIAETILGEHRKTFGEIPFPKTQILLLPFPQAANFDRWRAETRGSTVTIISAPTTFKSAAINRLHEQLRHELFHLWIPNSLNLSGNYDWFYEGFTLYKALKTGVALNQIRFDDFLSTLGRAFDLTEALSRRQSVSLVEASNKRWINSNELIYAKGIVVAFLCDATLLRESRGKRDLDSIFREAFQKHRAPNQREDGNAAILRILKSNAGLVQLAEKYIEGNSKIDWQNDLQTFGIGAEKISGATELKVIAKPSGRQKDLLNKLGYNQWRRLLQK
jgi:predicted metalloprotease with PDZ domain